MEMDISGNPFFRQRFQDLPVSVGKIR